MKHTPGPWLVTGKQRNGHFDFVLPLADDKDFQANCRLTAAAPEMLASLECLQDTLNYLATLHDDGTGKDIIHACDIVKQMNYIAAAIAKAKGE